MIIVKNVSKVFKTKKKIKGKFWKRSEKKEVVKNISFEVEDGEIVGYIGLNGAGKSTTIKMLCGILYPTQGEISINGIVPYIDRIKNAKQIGVVFGQRTQLWWDLPLKESFKIIKEIYSISDKDYVDKINYFDDIFNIKELMNNTVRTLSLGQRMKADITASLLHNPKVLFLDEPTIGLDIFSKLKMREAIKDIHKRYNPTIILTTHDIKDIEELCERIILLDKGTIIYDGKMAELLEKYSKNKILEFSIVDTTKIKEFQSLIYGLSQDIEVIYEQGKLKIVFDKKKIDIEKIISIINRIWGNVDFEVFNEGLENIIPKIYKRG